MNSLTCPPWKTGDCRVFNINPFEPVFGACTGGPGEPDTLRKSKEKTHREPISLLPFPPLLAARVDPHYSLLKYLEVNLGPSPKLMIL